jgi:leader peptidase (prepilin peptidase) / N-methyltransferase
MDLFFELPIYLFVLVLGACVGSFLNVVVYRIPLGLSLVHPPSRCPRCHTPLRKRDNLPVVGWLRLRGRCAHCHTPIAARYPLVEASMGLLYLSVFWQFGWSLHTLGVWALFSWLLALSLIDYDTQTLPNPLTQSGLLLGLVFQFGVGWQAGGWRTALIQLLFGVLGAVVGIWVLDLVRILGSMAFRQEAMGNGDPYLAAMMGAWLGWQGVLLASFLACVFGAVIGVGATWLGRMQRRQTMPFGPFLALGAAVAMIYGPAILGAYGRLLTPLP